MSTAVILFPCEPFSPRVVEPDFATEFEAARAIGFSTALYSHEDIVDGNGSDALARVPATSDPSPIILRGWMLTADQYQTLHDSLIAKGYAPVTSPDAYAQAHYLPLAYPLIETDTAASVWMEGDDVDEAWALYQNVAGRDSIIKDWVKSAKCRWREACFIPANTDRETFVSIFAAFREERSCLFNRGVVLREFMPIVQRGSDVGGLPIVEETRLFFWHGRLLNQPERRNPSPMGELARWETIAAKFSSRFITIDVALLVDGTWKIVEVGDGGVSGLPMGLDPAKFYTSLWNRLAGN